MGAGSEFDVATVESGQFGHPEAGLHHQQEQRPIPPSLPGCDVRCSEEGANLRLVEILDHALLEALGGQREHLPALVKQCRFAVGHMAEERPHRRQPGIAAASAVVAPAFEMVEEAPDEAGIDVLDHQVGGTPPDLVGCKVQQQPEGVAVAGHGVRACAELIDQPPGEERLYKRGQGMRGHVRSPRSSDVFARSRARARSSGTASMYHHVQSGPA